MRYIAVTGDSITHGMDVSIVAPRSVADLIAFQLKDTKLYDISYPSDAIAAQTIRWNAIDSDEKLLFDYVININGNNNLPGGGVAALGLYQTFLNLIRSEVKADCKIICCTLTPTTKAGYDQAERDIFNEGIRGEGANAITGADAIVTEFTNYMEAEDHSLLVKYRSGGTDDLHPSRSGRDVMADSIIRYILNLNATLPVFVSEVDSITSTKVDDTQIKIDWTHLTGNVSKFYIERSPNGTDTWTVVYSTENSALRTYTNTGLTGSTTYYYRMRLYNENGYSDYTSIVNATTDAPSSPLLDGDTWGEFIASETGDITKDGSEVISRWNDHLGSGNDLVNKVGNPHWVSPNIVKFDGAGDDLNTGAKTLNQPTYLWLVMRSPNAVNGDYITDGVPGLTGILAPIADNQLKAFAGTFSAANTYYAVNTWQIVRVLFNGANSKLQINNTAATTGNFGAGNMGGLTLAARGNGASNYADVEIKHIIVRNPATPDDSTKETAIYNYLAGIYGFDTI